MKSTIPPKDTAETWEKKKPTAAQLKYWGSLKGLKNEKSPHWKNGPVRKESVHQWLAVNFGRESICENNACEGKSKNYDWAKKTGYDYVKDRNAFMRLCRSCHRRYDLTPEKKIKATNNLWWKKGMVNPMITRAERLTQLRKKSLLEAERGGDE